MAGGAGFLPSTGVACDVSCCSLRCIFFVFSGGGRSLGNGGTALHGRCRCSAALVVLLVAVLVAVVAAIVAVVVLLHFLLDVLFVVGLWVISWSWSWFFSR